MKKLLLHEDMFFDIPNVDYKLDTELELKGPEPGEDVGVSGLLLDLIGDVAKNINDYNQLQANLENYPEIAELIKDFADDENMKLGKIQSALKTISPNAEYIMNGAVEAEEEMDPGSPLDESLKESFNEGFDPKDYNQALDDYMRSKNISVEKIFGALNYDDPRYIQLFNSLNDLGYKPRETGTYSRGYFVPAMTITLVTREVPEDVVDLIHDLDGVTGRHIGFHKGAHNWKLKFELRDDDFSSFRDEVLQSLDESLNEAKRNLKPLVSVFGSDPEDFSLHVLSRDIIVDGLFNPYTWEDGVPVLKYFERDKHPKEVSDASLKKGRQFIYDRYHWKAYFPYHGGWLCVDGDDLGWDRPDDEDDIDESLNESDGSWIQYYNSDVPIYSGDEQEAMALGRKHRVSNKPLMTKDEFMDYFIDDDLSGLSPREKNDLYSLYKGAYNQKREFKDGRVFPALDESVSDNDRWEEYYDSDLQRRFYFINAPGGKGEITYQDNDGNGYYRCSVWLNRRTHKYRTFNVTTSLKDAKEKVETLIDKYSDSKQESFDNEYWDSSRALDLATYCWDKGYDEDKAYQVTVAQLKKEGSALPKDLDRVKTVIYDYYDEQGEGEDNFLDESYGLYEMARVKRPNPEDIKILDSGYCDTSEWKDVKQKQISKYKKQYPGVKCELVKSDTRGLRMWQTYIEEE